MSDVYFGDRKVLEAEQQKAVDVSGAEVLIPRMLLSYEHVDGRPDFEAVHPDEYAAGQSDHALSTPGEVQKWFVQRSLPLRQQFHAAIEAFNPRFSELKKYFDWTMQGYIEGYQKCVNLAFGVEAFQHDATVEQCFKVLEDDGQKPMDGFNALEQKIVQATRSHGIAIVQIVSAGYFGNLVQSIYATGEDPVKLELCEADVLAILKSENVPLYSEVVEAVLGGIVKKFGEIIDKSVNLLLGGEDNTRRVDDLSVYLDSHSQVTPPAEPAAVDTNVADAKAGEEVAASEPVEPKTDASSGDESGVKAEDAAPQPEVTSETGEPIAQ